MAKKKLSAFDEKFLKMKRTTKNGNVFIPMRTYLGAYYLRFYKVDKFDSERHGRSIEYFIVSRVSEIKPDEYGGIFVCEAHIEEIKGDKKEAEKGFWIMLAEMEVITKMIKKLK